MPLSVLAVATSDQRVSLRRSSQGKSNRMARVMVVSSMLTLSTQLNSASMSRSSRISAARMRMIGSRFSRLCGLTMGLTVLRWASCLGGSMAMNMGSWKSSSWSPMVIERSEENTWWLVSTAMMSLYLVTDQYGPNSSSTARWTGSSLRRRSK